MSRGRTLGRRELLQALGALALAGCDSSKPRAGFLGAMERFNARVQAGLLDPDRLAPELPPGSETPYADVPKYFISHSVPRAPADWTLAVGGAVARPMRLTLDALMKLPRTALRVRHHCVEGWSVVAAWHGVRLRDLAEYVGAAEDAGFVELRSFDNGYWSSWDRPSAFHPQTILAYGMNGERLTPEHGAPLRLYSAVKLGYKMVKYLTEVNFRRVATGGYWEDQGYEWFAGV